MTMQVTDALCPHCVTAGRDGVVVVNISERKNSDQPDVVGPASNNSHFLAIDEIWCSTCGTFFKFVPDRPNLAQEILDRERKARERKHRPSPFLDALVQKILDERIVDRWQNGAAVADELARDLDR